MREAAPAKINTASVDDVRLDETADNQCLLPFGDTAVVDGVRAASAGADDWWWQTAWRALKHRAAQPGPFEAYDLAEMGVPEPDNGNRWGALFRAAATRKIITPVGVEPSRRPSRAGGLCRTWQGRP